MRKLAGRLRVLDDGEMRHPTRLCGPGGSSVESSVRARRQLPRVCGLLVVSAVLGCGGGSDPGAAGSCPGVDTSSCSTVVSPGAGDSTTVQTALISVKSGGTV